MEVLGIKSLIENYKIILFYTFVLLELVPLWRTKWYPLQIICAL